MLDPNSLAATLDAVNEALFFERRIPRQEARRVAVWLAARQGEQGAYAEMFAPTPRDYARGIRLFTGERIRSGAATGHILGEEACRTLRLLAPDRASVRDALQRASEAMDRRLRQSEAEGGHLGFY